MLISDVDGPRVAARAAIAALLALVALAGAPGAASAATYVNFNRETYAYSSTLSTSQEAARYQVMVLQSSNASMVASLKAANPGLKVLMYEGIMAAQNSAQAVVTCTSGPWVLANHPSWILKNQYGQPILYQNHYLIDVANTSYRQTCLQNVIATVRSGHFDGVYWDMVNAKLAWTLPSGTTVPAYPTDTPWQAALYGMLSYARSQLHPLGLMNVANLGGTFLYPGLWQLWNGPLDGAEDEGFTDNKSGPGAMLWAWPSQLADVVWSEANHKLVLLHSWNTTHAGNVYGLAAMMLAAGGESSYSTSNGCYSTCETWYPEYTTAQQLGAPVGPYTTLPNTVVLRWYQKGLVLVNPSTNSIGSFSLGGGTYTGSGLTHVGSVSMGATTGDILLADSGNRLVAPVDKSAPTVSGRPTVGTKLTGSPGTWSGTPTPTYAYQWKRCTATSLSSCVAIPGATRSSYTVQSADVSDYLDLAVTGVNSGGLVTVSSAETAKAS